MTETIRVEDIPADKRHEVIVRVDNSIMFRGKAVLPYEGAFNSDSEELPEALPEDRAELEKLISNSREKK